MAWDRATERALNQVEGYAADGLTWDEFGRAVIEVLATVVPNDATVLATVDPSSGLFTSLVRDGIDDAQDELFMDIELTEPDPLTLTTLAQVPEGVAILAEHVGGDPMSNARCRELLRPHFELEHELRGVARLGGRMWGAAALYRAPTRRGFCRAEAASLAALEGVIARGIQRCLGGVVTRWADADESAAVVLVDRDGRLAQLTDRSSALLQDLGWAPGRQLPTAVRTTAAAARAEAAGGPVPALARVRARSGEWLVIRSAALTDGHGVVAVTIEAADMSSALDLAIDLYGLSRREADVVRSVVAGLSTTEIAAHLAISAYTVQDHLKSAFRKVDVSSRGELVSRLVGPPSVGSHRRDR